MSTLHRAMTLAAVLATSSLPDLGAADPEAPSPPRPSPAGEAATPAKLAEYVKRLQQIFDEAPRDAERHFQLGEWCQREGLREQAVRAHEQALRIDPDHPGARAALGYRPEGLGWTRGEARPKPPPQPEETPAASPAAAAAKGAAAPGPAGKGAAGASSPPAPASGSPPAKTPEGKGAAETVPPEEALASRKRWAEEAFGKLEMKFSVYEDEDFLVHSSYEGGSPKLRALAATLKNLKKVLLGITGRPRGPVWPGKLHFIYMRASTECMRFAEAIDGQRFPEEAGYYVGGDPASGLHTVFSAVPEKEMAYLLGKTALAHFGNSDRYVAWWLGEGIAELAASATEDGKSEKLLEQAFSRAAAELQADHESVSLFKLIETTDPRGGAREALNAQAVTFIVFLQQSGKEKLHQLIAELKSPEAPTPPAGEDKLFLSKYTAYQERALASVFREKLEKMNENWKRYVAQKGAEIERTQKPDAKTGKGGKAGGGRASGGKGGGTPPGGGPSGGKSAGKSGGKSGPKGDPKDPDSKGG